MIEISSSSFSQWRPTRLNSTRSRWAGVACIRRGNQASGTPSVRPSLRSIHIVCSSKRTAVAKAMFLRIVKELSIDVFNVHRTFGPHSNVVQYHKPR